ncbi:hypothetical protein [Pedobacter sp. Leaf170]|uniref:hypothetical protein n=1 Tax=Pedobacter sp. Leaf170 TaxID=2876558 RepID=UPI001E445FCB|nr:hypothetical protein [Pedobacter sp. Leaf170]
MGLDTSHNAFHGAYSSFMRFRMQLLELVNGSDISEFEGYGLDATKPVSTLNDGGLEILFNHSDCDGEISPEDCKKLAESLDAYIPKMDTESELYSRSVQFRDGCLLAHSLNETLDFH